ncbi:MAG: hypothetical protein QW292_09155 [Candidatus Parvarchaeota archaeon]
MKTEYKETYKKNAENVEIQINKVDIKKRTRGIIWFPRVGETIASILGSFKAWARIITSLKGEKAGIYYVCNHHLGDTVLFCSFAKSAGITRSSKTIFIVPERYKEIPGLFGLNRIVLEGIPPYNVFVDSVVYGFLLIFNSLSKKKLIPQLPGIFIYLKAGRSKIFSNMYERQKIMFRLKDDATPSNPSIDQNSVPNDIVKLFLSYGLKIGRTVLLCPDGYSMKSLNERSWQEMISIIKEKGYSVILNLDPSDNSTYDSVKVFPSPMDLFWFSKLAGHAVSLRSGLSDLLSFSCGLKLSVLYNSESLEHHSDFKIGKDRNLFCALIKEFVVPPSFDSQTAKIIVDSVIN